MTDNNNEKRKNLFDIIRKIAKFDGTKTVSEKDLAQIYCLPESVGLICAKARDYDMLNNDVFTIDDNKCYPRNDVVCFKCKSVLSMSHTFYRAYQSNPHPEKVFCIGCSVGEVKEIIAHDGVKAEFEVRNRDNIKKSNVMFTNILFDEEMYDTLNAVFNGVKLRAEFGDKESQKLFMQFGTGMGKIMDAMIDPIHEAGWCKDTTCEWKPKPKKK